MSTTPVVSTTGRHGTTIHPDAPAEHGAIPSHARFPMLDGLRAIAVVMVVGTHAAFWAGRYERGVGAALLARLDVGVAVFFVLSGFLLVRPWLLAAASDGRSPRTTAYAWRRLLRIVPMYYVTVTAALTLLPENRHATFADWWHHLLFLQIYNFSWLREGLTQTWSLCTEMAFYVVLPLLGTAVLAWSRRFGWQPRALLGACAAFATVSVVWAYVIVQTGWAIGRLAGTWLPAYTSWFAVGIGLAVLQVQLARSPLGWQWIRTLAASPGICWAFALAAYVLSATPAAGPRGLGVSTAGALITKNLLYAVAAGMIVLPGALGESRVALALLANAPMQWLGRISYSVFLVHLTVLDFALRALGFRQFQCSALQLFIITMAGSVAVSAVTYRFVEEPALRLRHLVPERRRRAAAPRRAASPAARP